MDVLATVATVAAGLLLGSYLLGSLLVAVLAWVASASERRIRPDAAPVTYAWAEECFVWAEDHGFTWDGAYRCVGASVAAWVHATEPTIFCVHYVQHVFRGAEFRTELRAGRSLTTAANRTSVGEPRPSGTWVQTFPGTSLDHRWQLHREGVDYLTKRARIGLAYERRKLRDILARSVREHVDHLRSLPLWYLRWPYWWSVGRRRLLNKTVREQIESELVA